MNIEEIGEPKTELEVIRAKRTNIIALITLLTMIIVVFVFFLELQSNKKELEAQRVELEDKNQRLSVLTDELEALKANSDMNTSLVQEQYDSLATLIRSGDIEEAEEVIVHQSPVRNYSEKDDQVRVAFYSNNIPEIKHGAYVKELKTHYDVFNDQCLWLKEKRIFDRSTVVFFSPKWEEEAKAIKRRIEILSGEKFALIKKDEKDFPAAAGLNQVSIYLLLPNLEKKASPKKEPKSKGMKAF